MPAVLTGVAELATYPGFIKKVTAAAVQTAVAVGKEPYDGTQYRIMRRALATKVLEDPTGEGETLAWSVAANPTITQVSSDSDILAAVTALWDVVAGAYPTTP